MKGVNIRNKLEFPLTDVKVIYGESNKGTSVLSYSFHWSTVDVSNSKNCKTVKFDVRNVPAGTSVTKEHQINFSGDVRGYWQVFFRFSGSSWHMDKSNAQANA